MNPERQAPDSGFDEACTSFEKLLKEHNYPAKIAWITAADIVCTNSTTVHVKSPVPNCNEQMVRSLFGYGISQERGIWFQAIGASETVAYCCAWVPPNEIARQQAMMPKGLKLSVAVGISKIQFRPVRTGMHWLYLRIRHRSKAALSHALVDPEFDLSRG